MKDKNTSTARIHYFDYLRALSALSVCYMHLIGWSPNTFPGEIGNHLVLLDYTTIVHLTLAKHVNLGQIGVSTFFLLSAFLVRYKASTHTTPRKYFLPKFFKLYPTVILSVLISFLLAKLSDEFFFNTPSTFQLSDMWTIMANALLVQDLTFQQEIIPTFWFLFVIVKFYTLMFFVNDFSSQNLCRIGLDLIAVVCINSFLNISFVLPHSEFLSRALLTISFASVHIIYALLGIALYNTFISHLQAPKQTPLSFFKTLKKSNIFWLGVLFTQFVVAKIIFDLGPFQLPNFYKNYVFSLVLFSCCLLFKPSLENICPFVHNGLLFFSRSSLPIYTLHYNVGAFFLYLFSKLTYLNSSPLFIYLATFVTLFSISKLWSTVIEVPCMNFGKKFYKQCKSPAK